MKQDELTQSVKRKSRGGKRLLSMALAISIVSTMLPTASFPAKADTPIGVSSAEVETVCENHKEHDEGCGYVEAVEGAPCSHLNEDGTYSCAPMKDSGEASPNDAEEAYVRDVYKRQVWNCAGASRNTASAATRWSTYSTA